LSLFLFLVERLAYERKIVNGLAGMVRVSTVLCPKICRSLLKKLAGK
jgi:hypothetical protein